MMSLYRMKCLGPYTVPLGPIADQEKIVSSICVFSAIWGILVGLVQSATL